MKIDLWLSSAVVVAASAAQPLLAQAASQPRAGDAGPQPGDIVVTAQKRSESVQRVPIAVSVVSAKTLAEKNIISQEGLTSITSGLEIHHSSTGAQPFIRSIGNNTATPGNEPPVATYVDGVYRPSPSGAIYSFNAIERIEVLKGPQGTLFGRNAAGGVINIVTRDPQQKPSVDIKIGYANFNTPSGSFYGTTGITSNLALDLSVAGYKQFDGWGHNLYDGKDTYLSNNLNGRSKIKWTPGSRTTIKLSVDYDRTRSDSGMTLAGVAGTLSNKAIATGGYYDTNADRPQFLVAKQWGGALNVEQDLDWAIVTSITSGRGLKSSGEQNVGLGPTSQSYFTYSVKENTYTQELNIQSVPASPLKWIAGFYYYNDKAWYDPFGTLGTATGRGPNGGTLTFSTQLTQSYAGYAQATSPLWTDKAHVTLAIRYTSDHRELSRADRFALANDGTLTPLPVVFTGPKSITQNAVTYKVGLDYNFTSRIMGYATFNRGFKSGNFNLTNPTETPIKPEFIDAYEAGIKSRLAGGALLLNVSGFYYRIHDLQVRSIGPTGVPINNNAATARYLGLEGELDARLSGRLDLNANATYVSSKYTSFPSTSFIAINSDGTIGGSFVGNATGNEVLYTEPFSASIGLRYRVPVPLEGLVANFNVSHHARSWYDQQNILKRPARTMLDASVNWTAPSGRWGVDIWAQNLLDEKYPNVKYFFSSIGEAYSAAQPRTYGVNVRYHF